jgi:hypothetical protein
MVATEQQQYQDLIDLTIDDEVQVVPLTNDDHQDNYQAMLNDLLGNLHVSWRTENTQRPKEVLTGRVQKRRVAKSAAKRRINSWIQHKLV